MTTKEEDMRSTSISFLSQKIFMSDLEMMRERVGVIDDVKSVANTKSAFQPTMSILEHMKNKFT